MVFKNILMVSALMSIAGCISHEDGTEKFLEASRNIKPDKIHWEKISEIKFEWSSDIENYPVPEGEWVISEGMLKAVGGDKNRAILLAKVPAKNVKIEFDATLFANPDGKIGDITILLGTVNSQKDFFTHGYALTTGSYWNSCSTFYKKNMPIARTEYSPLYDGKLNRVSLEFANGHIRYWLNGRIILEAWDETPLELNRNLWVGLRTWATDMWIGPVSIYEGRDK